MAGAPAGWVPERGDIIFINHSPAEGDEIPGEHPMLVASTRAFNDRTSLVIGFPMTHSERHDDNPFAFVIGNRNGSTPPNPSYVLAHQPKSFDWRARGGRPHGWGGGYVPEIEKAFDLVDTLCRPQP